MHVYYVSIASSSLVLFGRKRGGCYIKIHEICANALYCCFSDASENVIFGYERERVPEICVSEFYHCFSDAMETVMFGYMILQRGGRGRGRNCRKSL